MDRPDDAPSETFNPQPSTPEQPRPERTCPNCGAALLEQKCKLLCPNRECGYYMSCSEFY
ncbi:MAG: hypothetical protein WAU32_17615 [Thermoanaerobaculia bacterium]